MVLCCFYLWWCFGLKITEVFYDGTDEYLELYNETEVEFSWNILFKWIKTTDSIINNVRILPGKSLLIWDEMTNVLDKSGSILWASVSFTDTKSIDIKAYSGTVLMDDFVVSESLIKEFDNKKTSFEKLNYSWSWILTAVNNERIYNVGWGLIANPWKIFTKELSQSPATPSLNVNRNLLSISEIYAVWNSNVPEYIVIKALTDYFGNVDIIWLGSWPWSKSLNIKLFSGQSLIITEFASRFNSAQNLLQISWISLTDAGEDISVYSSSWVLLDKIWYRSAKPDLANFFSNMSWDLKKFDKFDYPDVEFNFLDENSCSLFLNKERLSQEWVVSLNFTWIDSQYCEKPFKKEYQINWNLVSNYECNWEFNYTWYSQIVWNIYYGKQLLCYDKLSILKETQIWEINFCENSFEWTLKITEVHPQDDSFHDEFIELEAIWNFSGTISLSWVWRWADILKTNVFLSSWSVLVVAKSPKWMSNLSNVKILSNISLKDNWEDLWVYWQDGQLLDKVSYSMSKSWKSNYELLSWLFDQQNYPTPWYLWKYLFYETINFETCYINIQNKGYYYLWTSINLVANYSWLDLSNSNSSYSCYWYLSGLVLTWCNPWYFKFAYAWIHNIKLEIYKGEIKVCSAISDANYPQNFQGANCSYYSWLYNKRKTNYNILKLQTDAKDGSWVDLDISIYSLLPNPLWKDAWKEWIWILYLWSWVDLSWLNIVCWKNKYELTWWVFSWNVVYFTWDFKFWNKDWCVNLYLSENFLDKLCYSSTQSWKHIYGRKYYEMLKQDPPQLIEDKKQILTLNKLLAKTTQTVDSIKVKYEKQLAKFNWAKEKLQLSIEKYKQSLTTSKDKLQVQKQKYLEKIAKINTKVSTYKLANAVLKQKNKKLKDESVATKKRLTSLNNVLKKQVKLSNLYIKFLDKTLKKDWKIVYQEWEFAKLKNLFDLSMVAIKNNKKSVEFYGVMFDVYDLKTMHDLLTWKISLNEILKSYIMLIDDYKLKIKNIQLTDKNILKTNLSKWNYF